MEAPEGAKMGVNEFLAACGGETELFEGDTAKLGQRIIAERVKRGWSIADLAERSRLNEKTLRAVEAGGQRPTMETLRRLARGFEISIPELITGKPPEGGGGWLMGSLMIGEVLKLETPNGEVEITLRRIGEIRDGGECRVKIGVRAPKSISIVFPHLARARETT